MKNNHRGRRVVMRPAWHHLLFLHWEADAATLQRFLPSGLEIDVFENSAYVGLVPFTMRNLRPHGLPHLANLSQAHENFHEVNVRTYVKHPTFGPGVWFFSLDAANLPAVCAARAWYKLPYFFAQMSLKSRYDMQGNIYDYTSRRVWPSPLPASCTVSYTPTGEISTVENGTLEHFLVERYWLYSYSQGRLFAGQVQHKPYPLQNAKMLSLEENLIAAAGITKVAGRPIAHYARKVQVDIFAPQRVD